MSSGQRYPRKGEFGNPNPRCDWCGKPVSSSSGFGGGREYGTWCSSDCSAAGRLDHNTLIAVMMSICFIGVISILVAFYSVISQDLNTIFTLLVGVFVIPLCILYQISNIRLGMRIRDADWGDRWGEKLLQSENDFTDLHRELMHFVRTYPANAGISRRIIFKHMKKKGFPIRQVSVSLKELVGGGFVKALRLGRYTIPIEIP
ncbi:MAG: hypothetical protein KAR33_10255 [Candidatus Thorarchaeota archaeon]|nr:hypothetical protein [Candidatus Thorarchaeota archaeon]